MNMKPSKSYFLAVFGHGEIGQWITIHVPWVSPDRHVRNSSNLSDHASDSVCITRNQREIHATHWHNQDASIGRPIGLVLFLLRGRERELDLSHITWLLTESNLFLDHISLKIQNPTWSIILFFFLTHTKMSFDRLVGWLVGSVR